MQHDKPSELHDEPSELAALLREAAVPPSRVTAQIVVRLGRRSVRRRRMFAAGATAFAVLAVAGAVNAGFRDDSAPVVVVPPSATPSPSPARPAGWAPTRLANPPGVTRVQVEAVDSSGRFVLGHAGYKIVLWDNGTPAVLPDPEADLLDSHANGVNAQGTVVGSARRHDGRGFAWAYRDGAFTKLASPPGARWYQATRVNDRGDIIGSSDKLRALLWPAARHGRVTELAFESAFALGEDGTIGSTVGDGDNPCVIPPGGGAPRKLPGAPGDPRGKVFALRGEWAGGWVANAGNGSNLMAARWNLRTGELTYYPELTRPAVAVSATGAILSGYGRIPVEEPVLVAPDGTRHRLQGTIPTPSPTRGTPIDVRLAARGMSADGTIVVGDESDRDGSYALVWRFVSG